MAMVHRDDTPRPNLGTKEAGSAELDSCRR